MLIFSGGMLRYEEANSKLMRKWPIPTEKWDLNTVGMCFQKPFVDVCWTYLSFIWNLITIRAIDDKFRINPQTSNLGDTTSCHGWSYAPYVAKALAILHNVARWGTQEFLCNQTVNESSISDIASLWPKRLVYWFDFQLYFMEEIIWFIIIVILMVFVGWVHPRSKTRLRLEKGWRCRERFQLFYASLVLSLILKFNKKNSNI